MKNILCLFLIFSSLQLSAQKINLSGKDQKPVEIKGSGILNFPFITDISNNPAFAGLLEKPSLNIRMHSKWLNMPDNPTNIITQFDLAAGKNKFLGIGIIVDHYQFKTKETYTVDLAVSVKFMIGKKNALRWGISAVSFNQNIQNINRSGRVYEDMYSPFLGLKYPTFERQQIYNEKYFDLKTGIWLTHKNYFAGISILHITQIFYGDENQVENIKNIEPEQLPLEVEIDGGYQFRIGNSFAVIPMIKMNGQIKDDLNMSPSLNITYKDKVMAGAEYHNMNILAFNLGVRVIRHINIVVTAGVPLKEELKRISKFALFESGIGYIF